MAASQLSLLLFDSSYSEIVEQLHFSSEVEIEETTVTVSSNKASGFTLEFGLEAFIPLIVVGVALTISFKLTRKLTTDKAKQGDGEKEEDKEEDKGFWDAQIKNVLDYQVQVDGECIIEEEILETHSA